MQNILSKNQDFLSANLSMVSLMPSQHQFKKPCCFLFDNKIQIAEQSEKLVPKPSTYKRRKIFQMNSSPQSQRTAGLKESDLTQSTVQAYQLPQTQQKMQKIIMAKKKRKVSKENSLLLANGKLEFKNVPKCTLESMPAQKQMLEFRKKAEVMSEKEFLQNYSNNYSKAMHQKTESQQSLEVPKSQIQLFTFNSERSDSFEYSASNNSNSNKTDSLLRVSSPRSSKHRQIIIFQ